MKIATIILLMGFCIPVFAQTPEQLKEAQEMLKKMTPEQKKMMEQMGINPDPMSVIPKGTDVNQMAADHNNYIPKKNAAGIAAAGKTVTSATMPAYITSTNNAVNAKMRPEIKSLGEKTFQAITAEKNSAQVVGNNAAGLWIAGQPLLALYVMGKACQMEPGNANLTSNYASMLSMCGLPELAIPILNKLNAEIPRNSTILNNLGQAWFGLGDLDKARKYLDSTIAMYARHPQATQTVAAIEESKGNTAKAVEMMKRSISHAYSQDKENKLRKLGYKLKASDLKFSKPFKPDSDPLGLHKLERPPFPRTLSEQWKYVGVWTDFHASIQESGSNLSNKWNAAINRKTEHRSNPIFWDIGNVMLQSSERDGAAFRAKASLKALEEYEKGELVSLTAAYKAEVERIAKESYQRSLKPKKEGGDENEAMCTEQIAAADKYLAAVIPRYDDLNREYLKQLSRSLNEKVYWSQYMDWPDQFEITKLNAQQQWLAALSRFGGEDYRNTFGFKLDEPMVSLSCMKRQEVPPGRNLPDFDVVNCNLNSEIFLFVGSIKITCNEMTTKFKLGPLEASLKQDMNKVGFSESYKGCTVKLSAGSDFVSKNVKTMILGVVESNVALEAGVEAGVEFEFDRSGLADVTISGSAEAINNEFEVKLSLVSGKVSVESQTIFENVPR